MSDYTWAPEPRPSPEEFYDRLEEFFPNDDLDKPVIEASSEGTSPSKMSVRIVAEEHRKRIDHSPRADALSISSAVPMRKRSTKLWGSRLEEVTTAKAGLAAALPESPSGGHNDKPVIEASIGGISPTAPDHTVIPLLPVDDVDKSRVKGKKSIRIVAEEYKKRIDRTSRADAPSISSLVIRKRSMKLWESRLEEATTARAGLAATLPTLPPGGPKPIFKWVRGELIKKSNSGSVCLALNTTTGEIIVVKEVEMPRTDRDSRQMTAVQALKTECEILNDLDHPNIVQYLGFEETPNLLSVFLEYVPGGSIGSCLRKHGAFDEDVTKSFMSQILGGLEYLHSRNILHRDLKADNILVETSGTCKISDFGISERTDDINAGNFTAMQGTVFWMAPVGCVILEMWTGSRPWLGNDLVPVVLKLYEAKMPPPTPNDLVLSPLADDFRLQCFAINPEERPTATQLRNHSYLTLPPGWVFNGFQ